jgi:sugar lactone lactonase YvrE
VGLGGGYGLAFGPEDILYATGKDGDNAVLWKITEAKEKEVYAILDYDDPIAELMGSAGMETNITVDGVGNVWISGKINGQGYAVSKSREPRVIYLNQHISAPFQPKEDDVKGIAWDEETGKLYIITSGPTSRYVIDAVRHLTTLTPSADSFAKELGTDYNGWSKPPLYIKNEGILIEQPGIALVKAKGSPLFLIGHDRVFTLPGSGKAEPFGKPFTGMCLYGGAADESGNLYVSANNNEKPDNGKGAIYKYNKSGNAILLLADVGNPLGLAWHKGYLYIMDNMGDRILRLKTKE